MKGQIESVFQWIFVLIAGIVFLTMFFFLIQGVATRGEQRVQGLAVDEAARRIESALWQPDSSFNMTIVSVDLRCPAGTLTLVSEEASATVDRAPVFLPTEITGELYVVVKEVVFSGGVAPELPLGTVMYGLDAETYYILIRDGFGEFPLRSTMGDHTNIRTLLVSDITDAEVIKSLVPKTARTVVFVAQNNPGYLSSLDLSLLGERHRISGVDVSGRVATFYVRRGDSLQNYKEMSAETPEMQVGAVLSADSASYACGRNAFSERVSFITQLYENRAETLRATTGTICSATFQNVVDILRAINEKEGESYVNALLLSGDRLVLFQEALLRQSCPVIA